MRRVILGDIHGNLIALEAVMKDVAQHSPDEIWCLGDLGWLGPRASECIAYVRDAGWPTVKGNTDVWIAGDPQTVESEEDRRTFVGIAAAHDVSEDDARWLIALPLGHSGAGSMLMVHGTPDSPFRAPMPDDPPAEFSPYAGRAGLVVYGHVHVPFVRRLPDQTLVANPGSVGLPADGRTASYMVIDQQGADWTIRNCRTDYDVDAVVKEAHSMGGPAAERFISLLRT